MVRGMEIYVMRKDEGSGKDFKDVCILSRQQTSVWKRGLAAVILLNSSSKVHSISTGPFVSLAGKVKDLP